jgi:histidinol-phosphate aminotransferase
MGCILSVPEHIAALKAYEPGLTPEDVKARFGVDNAIKLASNENPLGTSPKAIEFAERSLPDLSRYPDGGLVLRKRLAEKFHTKLDNVIVGSGSEGIMANIVRTFLLDDDEVLTTEAAFLGFQVLARGRGVRYRTVPYRDWKYDLPAIADSINERTKLIYLANPNNPTGTYFTRPAFEQFYSRVPQRVLIILDEAYFEYAVAYPDFPDSMNYRFDNVITLRTFSKAYGLAAARVGYGFAHEDLISMLLKVKLPFEPSGTSTAAALGALEDEPFKSMSVEINRQELRVVTDGLRSLGITVVPSAANFVMVTTHSAGEADAVFSELVREGVIVRPLKAMGIPHALRITIGRPSENSRLLAAVRKVQSRLLANA